MGSMLLITGLLLVGQADPNNSPEEAESSASDFRVRRLVRQLDAPQLAQRDAAEDALLNIGPAALDHLPPGDDPRLSAEVQQRLRRIRVVLQQAVAETAGKASQVDLRADSMPLSDVLKRLAEQSGNPIVDARQQRGQPAADRQLNVDFSGTPFWEALDTVLDKANLTIYPFAERGAISIVSRPEGLPPRRESASYAGPFRIEPLRVVARRELRDADGAVLQLFVEIIWEPRLEPIALRQPLSEVTALAPDGTSIAPVQSDAELEVPVHPGLTAVELMLPLNLPPRRIGQIAALEGRLHALLPGRTEKFRFQKLREARNVQKRIASATVTFEQARRNRDIWELRIRVGFDEAGAALESHRGWILNNAAYLVDSEGRKIENVGYETTRRSKDEIGIAYLFDLEAGPDGLEFVYETPGAILDTEFPYRLENIPLP